ncbi:MAG: rRNA maturation RNase YbeY [Kangiellaceae bacterium]|nr:rRNA maturation RNase YbeY [Kangiellaceae bacterium]
MANCIIELQSALESEHLLPSEQQFLQWVKLTVQHHYDLAGVDFLPQHELTIRIVEPMESQQLNNDYRQKNKPTNVLSFPFEIPDGFAQLAGLDKDILGDLVICAAVVEQEAEQQNKPLMSHWAHMVIHGCLHLLGYDHINEQEAQEMESLEIELLAILGIDNPYIC